MPKDNFLIIPEVSSERRLFIPVGFMGPETLCSNLVKILPNATLYHFGILSSTMHNGWMRAVCGRLESRYRYSAGIVYNNFPWPEPSETQKAAIEAAAQAVLDTRAKYMHSPFDSAQGATRGLSGVEARTATLADLYAPLTMPPELVKAHQALDRAVDAAYGKINFKTEAERVAFLFVRYQQLVAPLALSSSKLAQAKMRKVV
jgi:hypothetical protein